MSGTVEISTHIGDPVGDQGDTGVGNNIAGNDVEEDNAEKNNGDASTLSIPGTVLYCKPFGDNWDPIFRKSSDAEGTETSFRRVFIIGVFGRHTPVILDPTYAFARAYQQGGIAALNDVIKATAKNKVYVWPNLSRLGKFYRGYQARPTVHFTNASAHPIPMDLSECESSPSVWPTALEETHDVVDPSSMSAGWHTQLAKETETRLTARLKLLPLSLSMRRKKTKAKKVVMSKKTKRKEPKAKESMPKKKRAKSKRAPPVQIHPAPTRHALSDPVLVKGGELMDIDVHGDTEHAEEQQQHQQPTQTLTDAVESLVDDVVLDSLLLDHEIFDSDQQGTESTWTEAETVFAGTPPTLSPAPSPSPISSPSQAPEFPGGSLRELLAFSQDPKDPVLKGLKEDDGVDIDIREPLAADAPVTWTGHDTDDSLAHLAVIPELGGKYRGWGFRLCDVHAKVTLCHPNPQVAATLQEHDKDTFNLAALSRLLDPETVKYVNTSVVKSHMQGGVEKFRRTTRHELRIALGNTYTSAPPKATATLYTSGKMLLRGNGPNTETAKYLAQEAITRVFAAYRLAGNLWDPKGDARPFSRYEMVPLPRSYKFSQALGQFKAPRPISLDALYMGLVDILNQEQEPSVQEPWTIITAEYETQTHSALIVRVLFTPFCPTFWDPGAWNFYHPEMQRALAALLIPVALMPRDPTTGLNVKTLLGLFYRKPETGPIRVNSVVNMVPCEVWCRILGYLCNSYHLEHSVIMTPEGGSANAKKITSFSIQVSGKMTSMGIPVDATSPAYASSLTLKRIVSRFLKPLVEPYYKVLKKKPIV